MKWKLDEGDGGEMLEFEGISQNPNEVINAKWLGIANIDGELHLWALSERSKGHEVRRYYDVADPGLCRWVKVCEVKATLSSQPMVIKLGKKELERKDPGVNP